MTVSNSITAEAVQALKTPALSKGNIYSNRIEIKIDNLSNYSSNTNLEIYYSGKKIRTVSVKTLKEKKLNKFSLFSNGTNYLKPSTTYAFKIRAVRGNEKTSFKTIKIKTDSKTYYKINSNVTLFKVSNGKMKKVGITKKAQYVPGILCSSKGIRVSGKSVKKYDDDYLYINQGDYKGYYILISSYSCSRITERTAKVNKVVSYAVGMNGGRYVWGGEGYRATDCSGLTMLSYRQAGVKLAHSTYSQAKAGKASSMKNIKAGDIIICNNYGHAALYIGNGKIIHAMSSYYGIRIQPLQNIYYCGAVNTVRTII